MVILIRYSYKSILTWFIQEYLYVIPIRTLLCDSYGITDEIPEGILLCDSYGNIDMRLRREYCYVISMGILTWDSYGNIDKRIK